MSDKLNEAKHILNSPGVRPIGFDRYGVPMQWVHDTPTVAVIMLHAQNLLLMDIAEKLESHG